MAGVRIEVNVDGLRAHEKLDAAIRALEPPSLTESMGVGADVFVEYMKEFVPVESGELESVIDKRPGEGATEWVIGPVHGSRETTPYANIQDEGGTNVGNYYMVLETGQRYHTVSIPGTNYVMNAFEAGREEAIEVVKAEVLSKIPN